MSVRPLGQYVKPPVAWSYATFTPMTGQGTMPPVAHTFWDGVRALLDARANGDADKGHRWLATQLYKLDQRQTEENWLRTVRRYAKGMVPEETTADVIAEALNVQRDALPPLPTRVARLALVEEGLGRVEEKVDEMLAGREETIADLTGILEGMQADIARLAEQDGGEQGTGDGV